MKKVKKYYQNSDWFYVKVFICVPFLLALFGYLIYTIYKMIVDGKFHDGFAVAVIALLFFGGCFASFFVTTVRMDDEKIYMNRTNFFNDDGQRKVSVKFTDIKKIMLRRTTRDSDNKEVNERGTVYRIYLVLVKQDGKHVRFLVKYYKEERIIQIMKDIIGHVEKAGVFYTGESPEMILDEYKQKYHLTKNLFL